MNVIKIKNKYLPKDTFNIIPKPIEQNEYKNYNFAMIYNLPDIKENGKLKIRLNEGIDSFKWDSNWIQSINKRHSNAIENLKTYGFYVNNFDSTLSWRMIIGLGASHPQETSITLHHIYGIPYIPGSAVKGVTRHWVMCDKFNNDEKLALSNDDFRRIFGTQDKQGKVIFFDTYPADEINLKIDVMTPHYPKYYSGTEPPGDWQSPNPIKFLTVEKTKFSFYLAGRDKELVNKAKSWLREALTEYGIGAKTSVGYGYFKSASLPV